MKGMARALNHTASDVNAAGQSNTTGRVTTIDKNGKYVNAEAYNNSEIRELTIMLPYGISSSALDGMSVQVVLNTSNSGTVVGVKDPNRPVVTPGQTVIYDKSGSKIEMLADGSIKLTPGNGQIILAGGGKAIARVGDHIQVTVGDHGTCTGQITDGSSKVTCG